MTRYRDEIPVFLFFDMVVNNQKLKNFCSSSRPIWPCLHHMVILGSQNKITDFLMILAWASPFNRFFIVGRGVCRGCGSRELWVEGRGVVGQGGCGSRVVGEGSRGSRGL